MAGKHGIFLVANDGWVHPHFVGVSKTEAIEGVDSCCTANDHAVLRSNPYWVKVRAYGPKGLVYEREIVRTATLNL